MRTIVFNTTVLINKRITIFYQVVLDRDIVVFFPELAALRDVTERETSYSLIILRRHQFLSSKKNELSIFERSSNGYKVGAICNCPREMTYTINNYKLTN